MFFALKGRDIAWKFSLVSHIFTSSIWLLTILLCRETIDYRKNYSRRERLFIHSFSGYYKIIVIYFCMYLWMKHTYTYTYTMMMADCQNRAALLPAVWCMITKFEGSGSGAGAGAGENGCSSLVGTSAFLGNNSNMAFFPSLLSPTIQEVNKTKCFYFT